MASFMSGLSKRRRQDAHNVDQYHMAEPLVEINYQMLCRYSKAIKQLMKTGRASEEIEVAGQRYWSLGNELEYFDDGRQLYKRLPLQRGRTEKLTKATRLTLKRHLTVLKISDKDIILLHNQCMNISGLLYDMDVLFCRVLSSCGFDGMLIGERLVLSGTVGALAFVALESPGNESKVRQLEQMLKVELSRQQHGPKPSRSKILRIPAGEQFVTNTIDYYDRGHSGYIPTVREKAVLHSAANDEMVVTTKCSINMLVLNEDVEQAVDALFLANTLEEKYSILASVCQKSAIDAVCYSDDTVLFLRPKDIAGAKTKNRFADVMRNNRKEASH